MESTIKECHIMPNAMLIVELSENLENWKEKWKETVKEREEQAKKEEEER